MAIFHRSGGPSSNITWSRRCYSLINRFVTEERLLECTHEEADDRIFFHANHAIKVGRYSSVVIASPDTDIFVAATHHCNKLNLFQFRRSCGLCQVEVTPGMSFQFMISPMI